VKLSFIIPAYNEEELLGNCLRELHIAIEANRRPDLATEVIVTNNNSTDATASVAEAAGATVVFEAVNQISRARNAGAAVASGEWLIFVDADSELSVGLLANVLALTESGDSIGCGSTLVMSDLPRWARWLSAFWGWLSVTCGWAAGSFIACRAEAFQAVGGFSEELFAAEEIDFSRKLKRLAKARQQKFTILRDHPLTTSNRKVRLYTGGEILRNLASLVFHPRKALRDKRYLDVWYGGRR